jgi:hypothetical protein
MSITKLTTNGVNGSKYDTVSADNYYMEPIATTLLTSAQASISFTNIPQGYKQLQIRGMAPFVGATNQIQAIVNSDSGANYTFHQLYGTGSAAGAGGATGQTFANLSVNSPSSGANSVFVADILDYANTNKYKTFRSLNGCDSNGGGVVSMRSSVWLNTAPITSLTIFFDNSQNLAINTRISLYGIKG